jgi:hypothetical protein
LIFVPDLCVDVVFASPAAKDPVPNKKKAFRLVNPSGFLQNLLFQ